MNPPTPPTTDVHLTKTRSRTTTVEINKDHVYESDATWTTSDGYVVHRTTRQVSAFGRPVNECMQEGIQYWVRNKRGYSNSWDTLAEARQKIAHLRIHNR